MSDYEISEWIIILTSKSTHLNSHLLQSQKGNNYHVLARCREIFCCVKKIVNKRLIDDC